MIEMNRRRLLQSASLLVGSACLKPLLAHAADAPAFSDNPMFKPAVLFLTWHRDPTTTMVIQWIGSAEDGANRPIWFAKKGSLEWSQAPSQKRAYPKTDLQIYRTELTGLEPDTDYRFRVGLDSEENKFRTMPAKATDTIEFVSGGDAGIGDAARHSNQIAAVQAPRFVLMGGDLAYENGTDAKVFLKFLSNYSEQLIDPQGRLIPMLACLGNHEVRGGYAKPRSDAPFFYAVFDGLFTDTGYATLDFGDYLSLVLLDTNHTSPIRGEQTSWLEKRLKEREDNPNLLVFYHVPSYPSHRPIIDSALELGTGGDSRKHWVPLFERYAVDAVFEHHDHTYKRTHPLMGGHVDPNGVPYLGDGSWGRIRKPDSLEKRPYLAVAQESYHLSLHRLEGKQRFHIALSDKGKVMDVCMTKKRAHT